MHKLWAARGLAAAILIMGCRAHGSSDTGTGTDTESSGDTGSGDDGSADDGSDDGGSGDGGGGTSTDGGTDTDGGTGSGGDSSTGDGTSGGGACEGNEELTLLAEDAELNGGWALHESTQGEGMYAEPEGQGSILFTVPVPCDDDWHVWIRYYDYGQEDSWFGQVDGIPDPPCIVEGDCEAGGESWRWGEMNWRDPNADPCVYEQDPWVHTWSAGDHEIEFFTREASAIARLIVTNDPAFTPP